MSAKPSVGFDSVRGLCCHYMIILSVISFPFHWPPLLIIPTCVQNTFLYFTHTHTHARTRPRYKQVDYTVDSSLISASILFDFYFYYAIFNDFRQTIILEQHPMVGVVELMSGDCGFLRLSQTAEAGVCTHSSPYAKLYVADMNLRSKLP